MKKVLPLLLCLLLLIPHAALAELLTRPEVITSEGRIVHPVIDEDNSIFRLLPHYYLAPGTLATPEEYDQIIRQFDVTFGVGSRDAGWYEPGGPLRRYTYCNYFSADVTQAMGGFIPGGLGCCTECGMPRFDEFVAFYRDETGEGSHKVEGMDNPIYADLWERGLLCVDKPCTDTADVVYIHLSGKEEASLNIWLHKYGRLFGWNPVEVIGEESLQEAAQRHADEGLLTVGALSTDRVYHIYVLHPNLEGRTDGTIYLSEAGARLREDYGDSRPDYEYFVYSGYPD